MPSLEHSLKYDDDDPLIFVNEKAPLLQNSLGSINFSGSKNEVSEQTEVVREKSKFKKVLERILTLTIEPFLFMAMFAYFTRSICVTNLIIDKACKNYYNYNDEVCKNLSGNTSIKNQVETLASDYSLYLNLIHMAPGAVVMIFLGPWSDRYGRKPPLLMALCGFVLEDIGIILNTVYFEASIDYLLISSVFSGSVGGFICVLTLVNSMASDITTRKARTIKYAILELSFAGGIAMGTLAGGLLYKTKYSYYASFGLSAVVHTLCIPWLIFVIAETRNEYKDVSWCEKIKRMFSSQNVIEGWKACIKRRDNYGRCQIWMLLTSMCAIVITYECFTSIAYLYTFHVYGWGPDTYSEVNTTFTMLGLGGLVFLVPIMIRFCKLTDGALGFIGSVSLMAKDVLYGLAKNHTWIYYTGSALGLFGGFATFSVRSRLSKIVDTEELGKVFAFLSMCESLVPQIGTIVITKVYNATLDVFPGTAYLVAAFILILPIGAFLWMTRIRIADKETSKNAVLQNA